ncbi:hypothetical protein [Lysobacter sp. HA35]
MSRFPTMANLRVIEGSKKPDSPAERVRAKQRKRRQPNMPQCSHCAGREYITAKIGNVSNKLCVGCLTQGHRRVMD